MNFDLVGCDCPFAMPLQGEKPPSDSANTLQSVNVNHQSLAWISGVIRACMSLNGRLMVDSEPTLLAHKTLLCATCDNLYRLRATSDHRILYLNVPQACGKIIFQTVERGHHVH